MNNPHLSPAINHNISMSAAVGGWWLKTHDDPPTTAIGLQDHTLSRDRMLKIRTRNTEYELKYDPNNSTQMLIKGHGRYCPEWTVCHVAGSTWGGSMLKTGYVGVGMHLELVLFGYEDGLHNTAITTTAMQEIEECSVD